MLGLEVWEIETILTDTLIGAPSEAKSVDRNTLQKQDIKNCSSMKFYPKSNSGYDWETAKMTKMSEVKC